MNRVLSTLLLLGITVCAVAAPPGPTIINTDEVPWDVGPEEGITLKRFTGALARLNLVRWADGTTTAPHTHATEQILLVQSGSYRITVEDEAHLLGAGDLIIVPSYALHGIEALEDSAHIAVFAPAALPE
jgi:quercetin dioxygenase-like cupin family protein